jgi:hypothetical protein
MARGRKCEGRLEKSVRFKAAAHEIAPFGDEGASGRGRYAFDREPALAALDSLHAAAFG